MFSKNPFRGEHCSRNGVHLQRKYENEQVHHTEEKCSKIKSFSCYWIAIPNFKQTMCVRTYTHVWMALPAASVSEQFVVDCKTWNLELHTHYHNSPMLQWPDLKWSDNDLTKLCHEIIFTYKESKLLWFHVFLKLRQSLILPGICHWHMLNFANVPRLTWDFL